MKEKEIWKDIKGYEGLYEVSSFGRVKSLRGWNGKEYILREVDAPNGYERAEDLRFTFENNDEIIELVNKRILHVQTAKTGESLFGPYMIGMSLLLVSIVLILFRRKLLKLIYR